MSGGLSMAQPGRGGRCRPSANEAGAPDRSAKGRHGAAATCGGVEGAERPWGDTRRAGRQQRAGKRLIPFRDLLAPLRAGEAAAEVGSVGRAPARLGPAGRSMSVTDQAFVTLATDDVYCQGALVLGQSLRNHATSRKLAVLITPEVSTGMRSVLRSVFDEVIEVDALDSADSVHLALMQRPELGVTFTKLHCWTLTHYSKCVFMDADTLVLCNVDELFDREEFSAAPDSGWPDCFNSGVFVFRPSLKTYNLLLRFAAEHGSFDGGDQGLLNSFFSNWATADIGKHLPFLYNLSSSAVYTYIPAFNHFGRDAKVVHFLGATKPWNYKYNLQTKRVMQDGTTAGSFHQLSFLALWWNIYSASVLPLLEKFQKMEESETEECKHTFSGVEITLKKVSPPVANSLQMPELPEQTHETSCLPEEVTFTAQPVCEVEQSSSSVHISEHDRPSEQLVFHPVVQETSELNEVANSVSELSIHFKAEEPSPEDERRKWEEGRMDYMGKDAFEHIKKKLDAFLH
ncbi:glycogenin-2 isoform X3 [Patagioenas fasciata]|uniref:glycogenin-2 isoform X3 n=1 Tax=Patagioenas fasciata TaxID=372321 RepID=UPI003A991FE5